MTRRYWWVLGGGADMDAANIPKPGPTIIVVTTTRPTKPPRCDRCGGLAYMHWYRGDAELTLCQTHDLVHWTALTEQGWAGMSALTA